MGVYYDAGLWDCRHTFDRRTFDLNYRHLAHVVRRLVQKGRRVGPARESISTQYRRAAELVARRALRRSDEWPTPAEWKRSSEYDPEDGPLQEAYDEWKAGYVDCATLRVAGWIEDARDGQNWDRENY